MNKPFHMLPLILTLIGIIILCALGTWQLQRLAWKTDILDSINAQYDSRAQEDLLIEPSVLESNFDFKRALLVGKWVYENQIQLGPRTHDGQIGYFIITPFDLIDCGILIVNRGWVPLDWPIEQDSAQMNNAAFITGLIKRPPRPNMFTAKNSPEKNQWVHLDVKDIQNAFTLESPVYDYVMLLESELPDENTNPWPKPIAKASKPRLNNNHLQYALFWFTMAGILAVIYVLRFHVKPRKN